ncbi:hypothetical protein COO60DRAFT_203667 [Scenedesmus sp. NREL 46B-D3]|nr:hypothetical protein COO60DRAFT_203667 [Scenedesmus sp. NREL 46B-D3]
MENYVRFENAVSPQPSRANSRSNSIQRHLFEAADSGSISGSGSSGPPSPQQQLPALSKRGSSWLATKTQSVWRRMHPPPPVRYESQYLTLIPLSDSRLKPRRTKLIVSSLVSSSCSSLLHWLVKAEGNAQEQLHTYMQYCSQALGKPARYILLVPPAILACWQRQWQPQGGCQPAEMTGHAGRSTAQTTSQRCCYPSAAAVCSGQKK